MLKTLAVFTTFITFGTTNKLQAGDEKGDCHEKDPPNDKEYWPSQYDEQTESAKFSKKCKEVKYPSNERKYGSA